MSLKPGNALCTYKLSNKVSTAKMYTVMHASFTCDEYYTFLYIFQQSINIYFLKGPLYSA